MAPIRTKLTHALLFRGVPAEQASAQDARTRNRCEARPDLPFQASRRRGSAVALPKGARVRKSVGPRAVELTVVRSTQPDPSAPWADFAVPKASIASTRCVRGAQGMP